VHNLWGKPGGDSNETIRPSELEVARCGRNYSSEGGRRGGRGERGEEQTEGGGVLKPFGTGYDI